MILKIILDYLLNILIYAGIPIVGMIIGYFLLTRFSNGEENWHDPYNPPSGWIRKDGEK